MARLRRLDLKLIELSHGVLLERLQFKKSLGYTQEWDVWDSTTLLEPPVQATSLIYKVS